MEHHEWHENSMSDSIQLAADAKSKKNMCAYVGMQNYYEYVSFMRHLRDAMSSTKTAYQIKYN